MTSPMQPERIDDGGEHPVVPWLNERRRAYFYRLAAAVVALGVILGLFGVEVAGGIMVVVAAGLSTGLAIRNTSTSKG